MSHTFYNGMWAEAQQEFRSLIQDEKKIIPGIEQTDRIRLFEFLSDLYIKYISVFKKMDTVHDQLVHPQKRPLIRKLLDMIIVRILELRQVLVETELSEFFYFDYFTQWMQWIPQDLDMDTPKYYIHERGPEFALREKWLEEECARKLREEEEAELNLKLVEEGASAAHALLHSEFDDERDGMGMMGALGMSYEKAILIVQTAERARQGRNRYEMAKFIYEEEERSKIRKKRMRQQIMEPDQAAIIIQRHVRRFVAYRLVQRRRNDELEFLGLSPGNINNPATPMGSLIQKSKTYRERIEKHAESRRKIQRRYKQNYQEAEHLIDSRLRLLEAAQMQETMKSQMREWILAVKERTGKLPDIPKSEFGGMKFMFSLQKRLDELAEGGGGGGDGGAPSVISKLSKTSQDKGGGDGKKKKKSAGSKDKDGKDKGGGKGGKKKGKAGGGKKGGGGAGGGNRSTDSGFLEPPVYLEQMIDANIEYNANWRHRDEIHNPDQCHEDDLIIYSKREILCQEIRVQVDTVMKAELQLLRDALQRKKGKKAKKGKKSGKSGRGGKKKGKKKKRGKDLTPDRTLESLYTELVYNGVIRKYPKIRFDDLYGESSLVNGTVRRYHSLPAVVPGRSQSVTGAELEAVNANLHANTNGALMENEGVDVSGTVEMEGMPRSKNFPANPNPPPSFGDIKRAMKDICVLPVGSLTVHQMAPFTKSLLVCGPEGSGKKSLVYAVCTELGATLFDLTPANIAGKYPGKPGLNMLMHLIAKVGRLAQPTVLFIDECDKTYQKRVPKTDKTEPKRLKKQLGKFIKSIGPDDQMILISLSSEPWLIPVKLLKKDFQKILYIPKPDHGDRFVMWQSKLTKYITELHSDVNCSLLAKLSDGWSLGAINDCVNNIARRYYESLEEERRFQESKDLGRSQFASHSASGDQKQVQSQSMSMPLSTARVGRKLIRMDDFLKELSLHDPLFLEQEKLWNSFFSKTPLQKLRLAAQESRVEGKTKVKGKGKGKKGKK